MKKRLDVLAPARCTFEPGDDSGIVDLGAPLRWRNSGV